VRGGKHEAPEGSARARNVVIEFPSFEAAKACYDDEAYRRAIALRQPVSTVDIVLVEGYDGPQPGD
jgi:uncharacterized protein (DUF1330 family)